MTTVARVAADQILFAPPMTVCFFAGQTLLEGGNIQQIKEKLNTVS